MNISQPKLRSEKFDDDDDDNNNNNNNNNNNSKLFTARLGVTSWAFRVFAFWLVGRIPAHVYESGRQIN